MVLRFSPTLEILPAALAAAVAAFLVVDRAPAAGTPIPLAAPVESAAVSADDIPDLPEGTESQQQLPPNHPPIGAGMGTVGDQGAGGAPGGGMPGGGDVEPAALAWKAPADWKVLPNASSMRLATYGVGDGAELTVVRAGGTTEANIERWAGQFDGSARTARTEKTVHGLKVTVVHISGTFVGGGGMPGASGDHAGWTMLAAIVEAPGTPYFFKLLGPSETVDRARGAFNRFIDGLAPQGAK